MLNGRRQPSRGGTSRMTRECQVRFCERLGVKFPGPTRHEHALAGSAEYFRFTPLSSFSWRDQCLRVVPLPDLSRCSKRQRYSISSSA